MDDYISRQAAIDALNEYFVRIGKLKRRGLNKGEKAISLDTVGAINSLPHAQQEPSEKCELCMMEHMDEMEKLEVELEMQKAQPEIIRCKDCENWDTTWKNDWAKDYHYCPIIDGTRIGDWYCADAKRRTDE